MTVSQGGEALRRYLRVQPYIVYKEKAVEVYCDGFKQDAYFILRTEKQVKPSRSYEVIPIDENNYFIHGKQPKFTIDLSR